MLVGSALGVLLVASSLRLVRLDFQSLWSDEISSLRLLQGDLPALVASLAQEVHPPLYFVLLSLWTGVFGSSEVAVRLPSALAGIAASGLLLRLGRTLFDARVGFVASLLFATSLFQIYYAQEARSYSLLTLTSVMSMDALALGVARLRRAERARGALLYYALSSTAMLYTHYFGFFILASQGACCVIGAFSSWRASHALSGLRAWWPWGVAQCLALFAFLPWLTFFQGQLQRVLHGFWIPPATQEMLWKTAEIFVSIRRPPWAQRPHWEEIGLAFALLLAIGIGAALIRRGRFFPGLAPLSEAESGREPGWPRAGAIGFVALWMLLPIALAWSLSALASIHVYTYRNLIAAQPAVCLLLAVPFTWRRGRWLKVTFAAALLAGPLGQLPWYYQAPHKGRWRELVAFVDRWSTPRDGVAFYTSLVRHSFDFHRTRAGGGPYPFVDLRQNAAPRQARVWLVKAQTRGHNFRDTRNKIVAWGYRESNRWRFAQAELLLFTRAPSPRATSP